MTNDIEQTRDDGAPARVCATCAHSEDDHVMQQVELSGVTEERSFCGECDDWCEFFPVA